MNIALVNSCKYLGGAEFWFLKAALYLRGRGHDIEFFCRPGDLRDESEKLGLCPRVVPMRFDVDIDSFLRFYYYFRKFRPDVVFLNDQRECRLAGAAAALAGVPLRIQRKGWPYLKNSWRDRLVYSRPVNHVFCVSEQVRQEFLKLPGLESERISLLPNGVDLSKYTDATSSNLRTEQGLAEGTRIVGTIGRLVEQKGHDIFIRAAKRLLDSGVDAYFVIAGSGKIEQELRAMIKDLGLNDRILLLGFRHDLPSFLKGLDIFVFASLQEGMPNAVLEAMAAGLPIVASDIPGVRELIEPGVRGILVKPGDDAAFAQQIERLLKDRPVSARLGENASSWVSENHDQERMFETLERRLKDMLRSAGSY